MKEQDRAGNTSVDEGKELRRRVKKPEVSEKTPIGAEEDLRESVRRYRRFMDAVADYIYTVELEHGRPIRTKHGPNCVAVTGYTPEEYADDPSLWFTMIHPDDRAAVLEMTSKMRAGETVSSFEHRIIHKDGSIRWVLNTAVPHYHKEGDIAAYDGLVSDITGRKRAEEALRESEEKFRTLFNSASDAIFITDPAGRFLEVNQVACERFGYNRGELLLMSVSDTVAPEYAAQAGQWRVELERQGSVIFETVHVTRAGSGIPMEVNSRIISYKGGRAILNIARDITERKHFEAQLIHQVNYDVLTGLPNRNLLQDRLSHAIAYGDEHKRVLAVMLLDLDQFKLINDTLGHPTGDLFLKYVADRLQRCVRTYDTVARLGGDEFVIILTDITNVQNLARVVDKVLKVFDHPFEVMGQEIFITASAGIAIFPGDGAHMDVLLKNADAAMYHAKKKGRNNYQFFSEEMNADAHKRLIMESKLRRALEREEFVLHYQPRVDLASGMIVGVEALIRWQPEDSPLVSPSEFISLLEETGLIIPVGEWVIRTACAQNKAWQDAGLPALCMAVNISARQFQQKNLPALVEQILEKTGLGPHHIEIELTESLLMQDVEETINKLARLKKMGIQLAIDDFGTGYSSLGYLRRFPIDKLKIDRSFVNGLPTDPNSAAIAVTIISMAHSLNLKVVAEGVETPEQMTFLIEHRCEEMQGYYFSRPLTAEGLEDLLISGERPAVGCN